MKLFNKFSTISKSSLKNYQNSFNTSYNSFSFNRCSKFNFTVMSNSNPDVKVK